MKKKSSNEGFVGRYPKNDVEIPQMTSKPDGKLIHHINATTSNPILFPLFCLQ